MPGTQACPPSTRDSFLDFSLSLLLLHGIVRNSRCLLGYCRGRPLHSRHPCPVAGIARRQGVLGTK